MQFEWLEQAIEKTLTAGIASSPYTTSNTHKGKVYHEKPPSWHQLKAELNRGRLVA
jgi:hypothetical protein